MTNENDNTQQRTQPILCVDLDAPPENTIDSLSTDSVVFGYDEGSLQVLLVKHAKGESAGEWALPGGWVRYNESVDDSASRLLEYFTGVHDIYLEQLHVFSDVKRVPSKRIITVAYYAMIRPSDHELALCHLAYDVRWVPIHKLPNLTYDHNSIIQCALQRLQAKVRREPIGFNLLNVRFTLLELKELYEAILGVELDKSNFRRKMLKMNFLVPSDEIQSGVSHRAAKLYEFDHAAYKALTEAGFSFEF